jgi:hypothetical protein
MHIEAFAFVARTLSGHRWTGREDVVEIGARNINGSVRPLFLHCGRYTGTDIEPGNGVEVVCSGADYQHDRPIDLAVCCEVLEHTPAVEAIIENVYRQLAPGGRLWITTAGIERIPHSAIDGGIVRDGEHYENITVDRMRAIARALGADALIERGRDDADLYAILIKPTGAKS